MQRAMSVEHGYDEYTLWLDMIDEAVRADDELPESREFRVRNPVTPI